MSESSDSLKTDMSNANNSSDNNVAIPMTSKKRRLFVAAIYLAIFAQMYATYATNTIAVPLAQALNGMALFSLIFTLGVIVQATLTPLMGKAGELFTKSRCVVIGAGLLLVQYIIIVISPSMPFFLLARAIGGVGSALLFTIGVSMFADLFPVNERAKYTGLYGSITAVAGIIAPTLAGIICDVSDWRAAYLVSIALGAIALLLVWYAKPVMAKSTEKTAADPWGALFLAIATICLVVLVSFAGVAFEWASPHTIILALVVVIAFVLFIRAERKMGDNAAVPLSLFSYRAFTVSAVAAFLVTMTLLIVSFYLPAFVQEVMGESATVAGLAYSLPSVVGFFGCSIAGWYLAKSGHYKALTIIGTLAQVVALVALALMGPETAPLILLVVITASFGISLSICSFIFISIVQAKMPGHLIASSTAIIMFLITLASAFGVALAGIIPGVIADPAESYRWIFGISALVAALALPFIMALPKDKKPLSE